MQMQKNTPDILKKIVKHKFIEVGLCKKNISFNDIKNQALSIKTTANFYNALKSKTNNYKNAVIAEIKKASPSKGVFREDFNPSQIAKDYKQAGATCISVLTDKDFFQGSNEHLKEVVASVDLPVLRKDFIIDEYQIYEAKVLGASCILLVVAILSFDELQNFTKISQDIGLDVLVEAHNQQELDLALQLDLPMIGINNRNLRDFSVSLNTTFELMPQIKDKLIITESGILTANDVNLMNDRGIYGFLVGEAFMCQDNIITGFKKLFDE